MRARKKRKKMVLIGQLAEESGVAKQTLYYYIRNGKLPYMGERNASGHRLFDLKASLDLLKDIAPKKRLPEQETPPPRMVVANMYEAVYRLELVTATLELEAKNKKLKQQLDSEKYRNQGLEQRLDKYRGPTNAKRVAELVEELERRDIDFNNMSRKLSESKQKSDALEAKARALEESVKSLRERYKPALELLQHGTEQEEAE